MIYITLTLPGGSGTDLTGSDLGYYLRASVGTTVADALDASVSASYASGLVTLLSLTTYQDGDLTANTTLDASSNVNANLKASSSQTMTPSQTSTPSITTSSSQTPTLPDYQDDYYVTNKNNAIAAAAAELAALSDNAAARVLAPPTDIHARWPRLLATGVSMEPCAANKYGNNITAAMAAYLSLSTTVTLAVAPSAAMLEAAGLTLDELATLANQAMVSSAYVHDFAYTWSTCTSLVNSNFSIVSVTSAVIVTVTGNVTKASSTRTPALGVGAIAAGSGSVFPTLPVVSSLSVIAGLTFVAGIIYIWRRVSLLARARAIHKLPAVHSDSPLREKYRLAAEAAGFSIVTPPRSPQYAKSPTPSPRSPLLKSVTPTSTPSPRSPRTQSMSQAWFSPTSAAPRSPRTLQLGTAPAAPSNAHPTARLDMMLLDFFWPQAAEHSDDPNTMVPTMPTKEVVGVGASGSRSVGHERRGSGSTAGSSEGLTLKPLSHLEDDGDPGDGASTARRSSHDSSGSEHILAIGESATTARRDSIDSVDLFATARRELLSEHTDAADASSAHIIVPPLSSFMRGAANPIIPLRGSSNRFASSPITLNVASTPSSSAAAARDFVFRDRSNSEESNASILGPAGDGGGVVYSTSPTRRIISPGRRGGGAGGGGATTYPPEEALFHLRSSTDGRPAISGSGTEDGGVVTPSSPARIGRVTRRLYVASPTAPGAGDALFHSRPALAPESLDDSIEDVDGPAPIFAERPLQTSRESLARLARPQGVNSSPQRAPMSVRISARFPSPTSTTATVPVAAPSATVESFLTSLLPRSFFFGRSNRFKAASGEAVASVVAATPATVGATTNAALVAPLVPRIAAAPSPRTTRSIDDPSTTADVVTQLILPGPGPSSPVSVRAPSARFSSSARRSGGDATMPMADFPTPPRRPSPSIRTPPLTVSPSKTPLLRGAADVVPPRRLQSSSPALGSFSADDISLSTDDIHLSPSRVVAVDGGIVFGRRSRAGASLLVPAGLSETDAARLVPSTVTASSPVPRMSDITFPDVPSGLATTSGLALFPQVPTGSVGTAAVPASVSVAAPTPAAPSSQPPSSTASLGIAPAVVRGLAMQRIPGTTAVASASSTARPKGISRSSSRTATSREPSVTRAASRGRGVGEAPKITITIAPPVVARPVLSVMRGPIGVASQVGAGAAALMPRTPARAITAAAAAVTSPSPPPMRTPVRAMLAAASSPQPSQVRTPSTSRATPMPPPGPPPSGPTRPVMPPPSQTPYGGGGGGGGLNVSSRRAPQPMSTNVGGGFGGASEALAAVAARSGFAHAFNNDEDPLELARSVNGSASVGPHGSIDDADSDHEGGDEEGGHGVRLVPRLYIPPPPTTSSSSLSNNNRNVRRSSVTSDGGASWDGDRRAAAAAESAEKAAAAARLVSPPRGTGIPPRLRSRTPSTSRLPAVPTQRAPSNRSITTGRTVPPALPPPAALTSSRRPVSMRRLSSVSSVATVDAPPLPIADSIQTSAAGDYRVFSTRAATAAAAAAFPAPPNNAASSSIDASRSRTTSGAQLMALAAMPTPPTGPSPRLRSLLPPTRTAAAEPLDDEGDVMEV